MRKETRFLICTLAIVGIVTLGFSIQPLDAGFSFDSESLRDSLYQSLDLYPLQYGDMDQTELMRKVTELVLANTAAMSATTVPFGWMNTFNFSNSKDYFGGQVMTEEEVGANLRNFIFQVLYTDLEAACETSLLDIALLRVFDSLIVDWIDIGFSGFCNGMAQASRDYFIDSGIIPLGRDYAMELPPPNPNATIAKETNGDVTESAIKEYVLWKGSGAFFNPNHLINWLKIYLGMTSSVGGTTNAEEFLTLTQMMKKGTPAYRPVVILLMAPFWDEVKPTSSHFVTAYDYEVNANGSSTIYIYNNWDIYTDSFGMYDDWILLKADGTFDSTHLDQIGTYSKNHTLTRMCVYPETSEYNSILTTLMDFINRLISLDIFSPVDVEVTDPLGRTASVSSDGSLKAEFPAIVIEDDGHKSIVMPYAPGLPYQVNLTGTDEGDYRMELNRVVDGSVKTVEVSGETQPGQQDHYTVTLDADNTSLTQTGVRLFAPEIISGTTVELNWSRYSGSDFSHYEILMSTNLADMGTVVQTIGDQDTVQAVVGGLTPEKTYFFTIRVHTTDGGIADSNRVGAILPQNYDLIIMIAAGAGGTALLIILVLVFRKRRAAS
ncbi:MAG: hypothetical protein BAJATHORv1_40285 [Candidatus Thorarchaeota archaeon]|nr:MAG: hypothetical protein BAJATHORv1_40285 [Candidatus Thorarchaeota archaeon]